MVRVFDASGRYFGRLLLLATSFGWGQGSGLDDLIQTGFESNSDLKVQTQEVKTASMDTQSIATAVDPQLEPEARHNLSDPGRHCVDILISREFQPH